MTEFIKRQDVINVVAKQYPYESDRIIALQELPVVDGIETEVLERHRELYRKAVGIEWPKELDSLPGETIDKIIRIADKVDISRDTLLESFATILMQTVFIGTFEDYEIGKMSNAERIQSMNTEELADTILSLHIDRYIPFCKNSVRCDEILEESTIPDEMCRQCLIEWLQSESEE